MKGTIVKKMGLLEDSSLSSFFGAIAEGNGRSAPQSKKVLSI